MTTGTSRASREIFPRHPRLWSILRYGYKSGVFISLGEARAIIEAWRHDYNHLRPHSSLGALTPSEFAALKREQTTSPQEGGITDGLYL